MNDQVGEKRPRGRAKLAKLMPVGDVVEVTRLAAELGIDVRTLRRWIAGDDVARPLPCYRPTIHTILIQRAEFAKWLAESSVEASGPAPRRKVEPIPS